MKQKRVGREQRNKYKPKPETGTTPSNQTRRQAGGSFGLDYVKHDAFGRTFSLQCLGVFSCGAVSQSAD
jgi:hypothetical protein